MGQVIKKSKGGKFVGWYLRWRENGRRVCIASKQPTAVAARKMLQQIEARVALGLNERAPTADAAMTVAALCERFLETSHPSVKDPKEYRRKARCSLRWVLPLIGKMRLDRLRRRDLEQARDTLSGQYKANTVRAAFGPLGAALTWAVRQELIAQSPLAKLPMPRRDNSTEHLSQEEATRLLAEAERQVSVGPLQHSLFIAVSLALRLGLRRGEVFGLLWQNVDIERGRLTVAHSYRGLPKNGKARTLPLPSALATVLRTWRAVCPPGERVCPRGNHAKDPLSKLLKSAGGPPLKRGWHSLRHTFASVWVEQGGSILSLKEMLGHSTLNMTLIYSHLSPAALAADAEKIKL